MDALRYKLHATTMRKTASVLNDINRIVYKYIPTLLNNLLNIRNQSKYF